MDYETVAEAAHRLGLGVDRIRDLLREDRFPGAVKFGRAWAIPKGAEPTPPPSAFREPKHDEARRAKFREAQRRRRERLREAAGD
jgi:excisionase family DNA binding protein